jgi:hypothetical protein
MELDRSAILRPVLHEDALQGLAGKVAMSLSASCGADEATLLTMFLTMFGNVIGRQPHVQFYKHDERAGLYTLIVGKWARGRKGTAFNAVQQLFLAAEPDWANNRIETGIQSPEALIELVADGPYTDPRLLIKEDEFGRFIATMGTNRRFPAQMRTAYDGSTLSRKRVKQPPLMSKWYAISLLGMITPGELIALQKLSGGLESRILYVVSAPARKTDTDPFSDDDGEAYLAEEVKHAINMAWDNILSGCGPITAAICEMRGIAPNSKFRINDDIMENWRVEIADKIEALADEIGEDFERYTARGQTHVIRLALTYALADGADEIDWPHMRAAMALWDYCARSARVIFSVPDDPRPRLDPVQTGKVFDFLFECYRLARTEDEQWATTMEITKSVLSNNHPAGPFLEDLIEQGFVESRKIKNGGKGRPTIEYRIIHEPELVR